MTESLPEVRELRPKVDFEVETGEVFVLGCVSDDVDLELRARDFLWKLDGLNDFV